jgi:hypothetical protein
MDKVAMRLMGPREGDIQDGYGKGGPQRRYACTKWLRHVDKVYRCLESNTARPAVLSDFDRHRHATDQYNEVQ